MFAYLESLVSIDEFSEGFISFLPIGNTHFYIDQLFSQSATRLLTHEAVTLSHLHEDYDYNVLPRPIVTHVSNFGELQ